MGIIYSLCSNVMKFPYELLTNRGMGILVQDFGYAVH